jgi:hypothetical protein
MIETFVRTPLFNAGRGRARRERVKRSKRIEVVRLRITDEGRKAARR